MSNLLIEKFDRSLKTSAQGLMGHQNNFPFIASRVFLAPSSTSITSAKREGILLACLEMTTSGVTLSSASSKETTQKAVNELRKLSGLTWEQLANLFDVSRRSIHFWASGEPLSSFNEEKLNRLLDTIQYINRGSASLNRSLLLKPGSNGTSPFDLLIKGEHEKVRQILGFGNAPPRPQLDPLSEEARAERKSPNPADLVDALQEPIHRSVGRSRPARSVRRRKNSSGQ